MKAHPFAAIGSICVGLHCGAVAAEPLDATAAPQAGAVSPSPAAAPSEGLADIVVTAQRKSERLQDVPISISAQSGADLARAGVSSTQGLALAVPSLQIVQTGAYFQPALRGVSSSGVGPGNDPSVALYIDGIYRPNSVANVFSLPDVQRIEVLKGPQGTLFGRNSSGGVIQVILKDPSYDRSLTIDDRLGFFDRQGIDNTASIYVNQPIVADKVAVNLSGSLGNNSGYLRDIYMPGGDDGRVTSRDVHGKIRMNLVPGLKVILSGYYSYRYDAATITTAALNRNSVGYRVSPTAAYPTGPWQNAAPMILGDYPHIRVVDEGLSAKVSLDVGLGVITSLTGYSSTTAVILSNSDATPVHTSVSYSTQHNSPFSEEINLQTKTFGIFSGVIGAYYFHDTPKVQNVTSGSETIVYVKSPSVFGEIYADLTSRLRLTAGGRYSSDTQHATSQLVKPVPPIYSYPATLCQPVAPSCLNGSKTWRAFTPRVSLSYHPIDWLHAYVTYSQGYKSGVWNALAFQKTPVDPERNNAYEAGIKIASRDVSFNGAFFYDSYKNLQVTAISYIDGAGVPVVSNAANAEIYGFDGDAAWRASDAFQIKAGFSYIPHAVYQNFKNAVVTVPTGLGGNASQIADVSGNRLIRTPRVSGSLSGIYDWNLASGGQIEAAADIYATSRISYEPLGRLAQKGYASVAGSVSYRLPGERLTISVWGTNLTNNAHYQTVVTSVLGDLVQYAPPREIGVRANFTY